MVFENIEMRNPGFLLEHARHGYIQHIRYPLKVYLREKATLEVGWRGFAVTVVSDCHAEFHEMELEDVVLESGVIEPFLDGCTSLLHQEEDYLSLLDSSTILFWSCSKLASSIVPLVWLNSRRFKGLLGRDAKCSLFCRRALQRGQGK